MEKLLSVCELAATLGRSESYIWAMKRSGFVMTGGRATLSEARAFLLRCQQPCSRKPLSRTTF